MVKENDVGTIITLLITGGACAFFVYMTINCGGALSVPFFL